jgi:AH receptor-interacting protein
LELVEPGDYRKDAWAMDEDEKMKAIPKLKEEGNTLYTEKKYDEAANKYAEALGMLENLMLK